MNAATRACALPGVTWDGINWAGVHRCSRCLPCCRGRDRQGQADSAQLVDLQPQIALF